MEVTLTFPTLLTSLFSNFGMFAGLFTILVLSSNFLKRSDIITKQVILGLFFGLAAAASIFYSTPILPGIVLDSRTAILTMAGLFFGPVAALISAIPAIAARFFMGGEGKILGILVIVVIALIGVFYRFILEKKLKREPDLKIIMIVSVINTLIIIGLSYALINKIYAHEAINIILPAFIIHNFSGTFILGALLVISYRNLILQHEIGLASSIAYKARNAKTEFLAMMSHEIRTPMNGVLGFAEVLGQTNLDEYQKHCVSQIKTAGTTMMRLLDDILDFSKIEAGKFSLSHHPMNFISTVETTYNLMSSEATAQNNKLILNISDDVPRFIFGDQHRIRQILYNLLGNAVKFTEKGTIELIVDTIQNDVTEQSSSKKEHATATLNQNVKSVESLSKADGILHIRVVDTGIGIHPSKLETIFSAFEQEDSSTSRKYGGSGLGLTIVKRLVHLMGGQITVDSKLGKGATFSVTLPYVISDAVEDEHVDVDIPKVSSVNLNSYSSAANEFEAPHTGLILLAEDIEMNQELAASMLIQNGYQVHAVKTGKEAVDAVKSSGPFNLVLMDIRMPEMNGIVATQIIREELGLGKEDLPIVALTAHVMGDEIRACVDAGMDDYLSKPVNAQALIETVSKWIKPSGTDSFDELLNVIEITSDGVITKPENADEEEEEAITNTFVHDPFGGLDLETSPIIDAEMVNQFNEFMGKDKLMTVYESFIEDVRVRLDKIRSSSNDFETIKNETHALASTSGNLGMLKLSLLCRKIMDLTEEEHIDADKIQEHLEQLQKLSEESCDQFKDHMKAA